MLLLVFAFLPDAAANSTGLTGYSTTGCVPCHGSSADADVSAVFSSTSGTTVAPGDSLALGFVISSANGDHEIGGFNVSASAGTLVAGSDSRVSGGEVTHRSDKHFTSGSSTFNFSWTAPAAEGTYTLYGAGNAGNHDHADTGDGWSLDTITITVDDGCDDLDGDGYEGCDDGSGPDCDDDDVGINPAATETCDGEDENCDGTIDDSPSDGAEYWLDTDEDGWGDDASGATRSCSALTGYVTVDGDCDDADPDVNPDGEEVCDGVDNDCDGATDDGTATDADTFYADTDADGWGDASATALGCEAPAGYVADDTDCDDTRAAVSPGEVEVCDSLDVDEDCSGAADDADAGVTGTSTFYADGDADGYGGETTAAACSAPSGYSALDGDCDDTDTAFNPAATEACDDPTDYNCDGSVGYADADADGVAACVDCDDTNAAVLPGATESCNGVDDDCDATVDESDASDATAWYEDADTDGYGASGGASTTACDQPDGYADNAEDCDDTTDAVRPDAPEVWYDDVDQDCDGNDDDQDGDGYAADTDCEDTVATTYPGAEDAWYDGVDADCAENSDYDADADGQDSETYGGTDCDDADATVYTGAPDEPYDGVVSDCDEADEYDVDGDGYDEDVDCDDANSDIHPGADESWYDGVDQDCDDNDDDQDGDGTTVADDCDDTDPAVVACAGDSGGDDTGDALTDGGMGGGGGCGCDATPGAGGALLGLLAVAGAVGRRNGRARGGLPSPEERREPFVA